MVKSAVKEIPEALRLLAQTIERDPRYGPALAWGHAAIFGFARTAGAQIRRRIVERAPISHVYLVDSTSGTGTGTMARSRLMIPRASSAVFATPSNASCISRVCAWRWANRHSDRLNGRKPAAAPSSRDKDEAGQARICVTRCRPPRPR